MGLLRKPGGKPHGFTLNRRWHAPGFRSRVLGLAAAKTLLVTTLLMAVLSGMALNEGRSEPNYFEQRKIEAQALEAFKRVITLWREEVYFELYDFGMQESQGRISRENFAQRMVELAWVPEGELNPKYLKLRYHFRTMVYVTARVPYKHKFDQTRKFTKNQTLVMVQEKGSWKLDLIELIRSPYSGV